MKKSILIIAVMLVSIRISFAQFFVNPTSFSPTGVSNQGDVVGYDAQAGPYSIWKPDSAITVNIGGLAPGMGIGSQARFSDDGNYISGTSAGSNGAELSRYNKITNQWSLLGSLGFAVDSTVSGGFNISGDGNTVVGLSWADTAGGHAYAHAVAWNASEGVMDLGSVYDSIFRSTRANAVSSDGNVVVGWQDFNGPWKSAVWRKNPGGGYFPNEYLLIDTTGSATDEYNQLGECSCISSDGNWIGGYGDYANNGEPWIWSRPTGVINLGMLPNTSQGYVASINADGTMAVGWFDGLFFGDPQVPFIWTSTNGIQNLNGYIQNTLGFSMGPNVVYAAYGLSANGQYITGYGVDTVAFTLFAYRVNAIPSGIDELSGKERIKIYPNPMMNDATVLFPEDGFHHVDIFNAFGKKMLSSDFTGRQWILEKANWAPGIYFLQSTDKNEKQLNTKIIVG